MTAPGVADVRIRWVDGHSMGLGHWCAFGSLAVMGPVNRGHRTGRQR